MNNSLLAIEQYKATLSLEEPQVDTKVLQEREGELFTIIEAIQGVQKSKYWSTLKEKVFDKLATSLEKDLASEAKKEVPDTLRLNRLAGQLKWAERYADLSKLERDFRTELTNIRLKTHGTT